ncbi:MAG: metallophosphoesterase family protein [Patescibacteria group bacterium]
MVGIIADLHDHLLNFDVFLEKTAPLNLEELWIAGDVGTPETVSVLAQKFLQPIRLVAGNVETGHKLAAYTAVTQEFKHLTWSATEPLAWTAGEATIALFHFPRNANHYVRTHQPTLVVSGHIHRPNLKKINNTWHINPGTLAGIFTPATYVTADLSAMTFILKRLY